jgi:hypothetical protein
VTRYEPTGPIDLLGCRTLIEVCGAIDKPLVIGAWMTRAIVLSRNSGLRVRRTNDVDVAAVPEVANVVELSRRLAASGYQRDQQGYPFRYSRMTPSGLQIVDVMVDASSPSPDALGVLGLRSATVTLDLIHLDIQEVGMADFRVPSLDGAFLLRVLALQDGPGGLKFPDYAGDAGQLALFLVDDPKALASWERRRDRSMEDAIRINNGLFDTERSPGSIAAARLLGGDEVLAARRVTAAMTQLFPVARRT